MIVWESVFPPPPPPLEDSRGGQRYLVEQLLNHRDVNGRRTSYLVRWRGYPPVLGFLGAPLPIDG
uniref:Chromo domain-containing protein n=1 Tax=Peronospora matthiolae TaxID=2874970 RepID=A0AAV1T7L6_9STRA